MKCGNCGRYNEDKFKFCETCGTPLERPPAVQQGPDYAVRVAEGTIPQDCSLDQRRTILSWAISQRIRSGYRIIERGDTNVLLIKPKKFSIPFVIVSLILVPLFGLGLIPLVIYLFIFMARKNKSVYLEVDRLGRLKVAEDWMV